MKSAALSADQLAYAAARAVHDLAFEVTFYAVCNVGGPISVRLDGDTLDAAHAAFAALDGRAAIDSAKTDAEDDLEIEDAETMSEDHFEIALEAAGAVRVADLEPIVNAHAGTVAHLANGWTLWSVKVAS